MGVDYCVGEGFFVRSLAGFRWPLAAAWGYGPWSMDDGP